jgi:hypothetical protein
MIATAPTDTRELARRTNDGFEVSMFWSESSNQITITVLDTRTDEALEFEVDGNDALDAFRHPYAYAAVRRVRSTVTPDVALAL